MSAVGLVVNRSRSITWKFCRHGGKRTRKILKKWTRKCVAVSRHQTTCANANNASFSPRKVGCYVISGQSVLRRQGSLSCHWLSLRAMKQKKNETLPPSWGLDNSLHAHFHPPCVCAQLIAPNTRSQERAFSPFNSFVCPFGHRSCLQMIVYSGIDIITSFSWVSHHFLGFTLLPLLGWVGP